MRRPVGIDELVALELLVAEPRGEQSVVIEEEGLVGASSFKAYQGDGGRSIGEKVGKKEGGVLEGCSA